MEETTQSEIDYKALIEELSSKQQIVNRFGASTDIINEIGKDICESNMAVQAVFKAMLKVSSVEKLQGIFDLFMELYKYQGNISEYNARVREIKELLNI